jgi:hypothetical protein
MPAAIPRWRAGGLRHASSAAPQPAPAPREAAIVTGYKAKSPSTRPGLFTLEGSDDDLLWLRPDYVLNLARGQVSLRLNQLCAPSRARRLHAMARVKRPS